jgi:ubiquinone/menaquinone biosynthesis C-methylase UbiE
MGLPRRDVSMLISGNKDSLLRFIKNTDSVTDLGGGKGDRWVSVLSKFPNLNLTFFEPDKTELGIAKTKIKGKNIIFFDDTKNIENESQDLVYSFAVLEHVWDKQMFFNEIARILKKDGVAYISYDDGHFRNYLYRDKSYSFQYRNFIKTKLHKLWQLTRWYSKYQYPVNPVELLTIVNSVKLSIIDDYYSSIDNFKNFKVSEKLDLFRENSGTVYDLEKELNIEYQKHFTLNQRIGMHGPLWKVMGTRTIKVKRITK